MVDNLYQEKGKMVCFWGVVISLNVGIRRMVKRLDGVISLERFMKYVDLYEV